MTKINYENTYIYKIVCKDLNINKCYVGSTTNFIKRKYLHKFVCNNETHKNHKLPLYTYIRENEGWDNFDMILIEKNSLEVRMKEREYYELLNSNLNVRKPYLNELEKGEYYKKYTKNYNNDNKDYFKEYYQNNRDIIIKKIYLLIILYK